MWFIQHCHTRTRKKPRNSRYRYLQTAVASITYRSLVRMLYCSFRSWALGDSWELGAFNSVVIRADFNWASKNQNPSNHSDQSQQTQTTQWTNQNTKKVYVKRGKMRACNSRLILLLLLIDWESGASFVNQSQSEVMQNERKRELLSALNWKPLCDQYRDWNPRPYAKQVGGVPRFMTWRGICTCKEGGR